MPLLPSRADIASVQLTCWLWPAIRTRNSTARFSTQTVKLCACIYLVAPASSAAQFRISKSGQPRLTDARPRRAGSVFLRSASISRCNSAWASMA
jgi:hypothetical protein